MIEPISRTIIAIEKLRVDCILNSALLEWFCSIHYHMDNFFYFFTTVVNH